MNYEKAYKTVLQTATQWIKDGCTDKEKICLESVFPELRESEDERTRKEIINFLRSPFVNENITDEKVAPWIAYLEKQKDAIIDLKEDETTTVSQWKPTQKQIDVLQSFVSDSISLGEKAELKSIISGLKQLKK